MFCVVKKLSGEERTAFAQMNMAHRAGTSTTTTINPAGKKGEEPSKFLIKGESQ